MSASPVTHPQPNRFGLAGIISVALIVVSGGLAAHRGGVLSFLGIALGLILLGKSWFSPSRRDVTWVLITVALWAVSWVAIFQYVISKWEEAEVIEIRVTRGDESYSARTWIMDDDGTPVAFYDAPPDAAVALQEAQQIHVTRGEKTELHDVKVVPADQMSEADVERIYGLMGSKYGHLDSATTLYFGALGRSSNKTMLVFWLTKPTPELR